MLPQPCSPFLLRRTYVEVHMIKFSTTTAFCGKPTIDHDNKTIKSPFGIKKQSALSFGFVNQKTSLDQLFEWLTVDGYAYAPALILEGHRKGNNFAACFVAFVDIDHGMTINDLFNDRLYKKYGSGYYTTSSHTDNDPRFRILFCLESPITNGKDMTLLYQGLISYYGTADESCKDPCRLFYGSINAKHCELTDRVLPTDLITKFIAHARKLKNKKNNVISDHYETPTDAFKERVIELAHDMFIGSYPKWLRFGWSLKAGGFSVEDFVYITQGMMSQKSSEDAVRVWEAGKAGPITLGTAIYTLNQHYGADCLKDIPRLLPAPIKPRIQHANKHVINYISSDPGTGKSYAIVQHIKASTESFIIAVPTVELMKEYALNFVYNCQTILSTADSHSVGEQLNYALANNTRVILITHAALMTCISVTTFKKFSQYNLFIDEVFQPIKLECLRLKNSIAPDGVLHQLCDFVPLKSNHNLIDLKIKADRSAYCKYQKTFDTKDSIENVKTREFLQTIDDPTKRVIISKMKQSTQGNYGVATLLNVHLLKHFGSVTLVSAFVEYTMLFHVLHRYYNMVNVTSKYKLTRNLDHRFSNLVLMFLTTDNYSKYFRDRTRFCLKEDKEDFERYYKNNNKHHPEAQTFVEFTKQVIEGCHPFDADCTLMVNNLDDGLPEVGIRLSAMSHGINKHQDKHSLSYVAAFNLPPWTNSFLKNFLPEYDLWFEKNVLTSIQCVMRTSLRDTESNKVVNALICDHRTCVEIKVLLKGLPEIKNHCLTNDYDSYTIKNEPKERLSEKQKRENKRLSNLKTNTIHNKKRSKNKL